MFPAPYSVSKLTEKQSCPCNFWKQNSNKAAVLSSDTTQNKLSSTRTSKVSERTVFKQFLRASRKSLNYARKFLEKLSLFLIHFWWFLLEIITLVYQSMPIYTPKKYFDHQLALKVVLILRWTNTFTVTCCSYFEKTTCLLLPNVSTILLLLKN